jgi:hypothetical protein
MFNKLDVTKKSHLIPLIVIPLILGMSIWGFVGYQYY